MNSRSMSTPLLATGYICRACRARVTRQGHRWASHAARRKNLPEGPVRTRFAPSPTGYLHFGSVRTALFNYLIARRTGGQFLLRIEDTDQKRTIPGAEKRIIEDLLWLGLKWDEGPEVGGPHGPYRQSERSHLYSELAQQLVGSGHAYRCFCSTDTLQAKGQQRSQAGLATLYDRTCYHLSSKESDARVANGEKFVVRLKAEDRSVTYTDIVGGPYELSPTAARRAAAQGVYDDFILMKQDGLPTYHFANVVDDHHMDITHVIRGVEWQISTPKHLILYDAFGWKPPSFGHIGLLLNEDGTKMSKRDKTFDLHAFKDSGVLPEALVNFLALHGWSHSQRSDYMSLKDLETVFDLNLSNTNPTVSLPKLWFLAPKHAVKRVDTGGQPLEDMVSLVCRAVQTTFPRESTASDTAQPARIAAQDREYIKQILKADAKNYVSARDFVNDHAYFFTHTARNDGIAETLEKDVDRIRTELAKSIQPLCETSKNRWNHDHLAAAVERAIQAVKASSGTTLKKKEIWKVLRFFLTGGKKGPSLIETMEILGPEVVMERLSGYKGDVNVA